MIELGADNWDAGLELACSKGNINMVKKMMDYGAVHVNIGFGKACKYKQYKIQKYLIKENKRKQMKFKRNKLILKIHCKSLILRK